MLTQMSCRERGWRDTQITRRARSDYATLAFFGSFLSFPYLCVRGRVCDDSSKGSGNVCGHGSTT